MTQISGCTRNKSSTKGGHGEANKSSFIIYWCFFCNSIEHKIYNYLHKDAVHVMFKEKATMATFKKENYVTINMVLVITTYSQIPENIVVLLKEKKPHKKNFNVHLKKILKTCNRRNLQRIYLELV